MASALQLFSFVCSESDWSVFTLLHRSLANSPPSGPPSVGGVTVCPSWRRVFWESLPGPSVCGPPARSLLRPPGCSAATRPLRHKPLGRLCPAVSMSAARTRPCCSTRSTLRVFILCFHTDKPRGTLHTQARVAPFCSDKLWMY